MSANIKLLFLLSMQCWGSIVPNELQIEEPAILLGISSQVNGDKILLTCTAYGEPPSNVEWAMDKFTENWITSNKFQIGELPVTISILHICYANIPKYFQVSCSAVNNVIETDASMEGYSHVLFNVTDGVVHAVIGQKVEMEAISTTTDKSSLLDLGTESNVVLIGVLVTVGIVLLVGVIAVALVVAYAIYAKTRSVKPVEVQPDFYHRLQHWHSVDATQPEHLVAGRVPHPRIATGNTYAKPSGYSSLRTVKQQQHNEEQEEASPHRYTDLIRREHTAGDDNNEMVYCEAYEEDKTQESEYQGHPADNKPNEQPEYEILQATDTRTIYQNLQKQQPHYENVETNI